MSTVSRIEWTETTWNPTTGCDRISPGCDNCYALTLAKRLKAMGSAKYQIDGNPQTSGPGFGLTVHESAMLEPLSWRTGRRVFVDSMSDLGHARVGRAALARVWAVMALAGRHDFQVLTKRPRRLATVLADPEFRREVGAQVTDIMASRRWRSWQLDLDGERAAGDGDREVDMTVTPEEVGNMWAPPWPVPNVWVGTSIENDDYSWRADELRRAPAAVRFLSLEPLLGPVPSLQLDGVDWVIVGGESGPRHRPLDLEWVREVRDRAQASGTALFFKQVGGRTPKAGGRLLDGRTWDDYPAHRVDADRSA